MFDLSWAHILILLVVALIVVGPKDLPRLMHIIGRWMGKARARPNEFRMCFD
jgi:sec-independent protein translocase protein TatB